MRTFAKKPKASEQATPADALQLSSAHVNQRHDGHSSLQLESTLENQAEQRSLQRDGAERNAVATYTAAPHFAYDFSRIPVHPPTPRTMQTKLAVNAPGDEYEQEADRLAEQVMSMPEPATQQPVQPEAMPDEKEVQTKPLAAMIKPLVQRETMPGEEPAQAKLPQPDAMPEEEKESVQTKSALQRSPDGNLQVGSSIESRLTSSKGGGGPLPIEVRAFMEPRFGADFSQVRVHTDSEAVQMNRDLNAQAFTHRQDVYFGAGKTPGKDALTAHELTHVVQQTGDRVQRAPGQTWIGERINWVRTATHIDNWANANPPGAYYVLNGLSMDDMVQVLRALSSADRKKLSDNLDEHGTDFDRSRIQLALTNATTVPGNNWWRDLSEKVHWAIRSNNFVEYPNGAFWLINPLNEQDTIKIMTFLHRDSLSELIANGDRAIEAGVPNAKRILAAARNKAGIPMGGTYDDYKSNPDYLDNFNSAAYSPLSKTLHLFFDNGGEAVLPLPLRTEGVVLVFQWKSLIDNPGSKDLKIYPTLQTGNTLPIITQWLADHNGEMQQSDLLVAAGFGALNARSLPENLWWLALLAPTASLGARFAARHMRPAFETVKPEPEEIPIIKADAKGGSPAKPASPPPSPKQVISVKEPGQWRADFEGGTNMSTADSAYEARVCNKQEGMGYYVNGVQFDGYENNTLLDGKNWAANGRITKALERQEHWAGWKVVNQAESQLEAAGNTPVEWRVASQEAVDQIRAIFKTHGISINVNYYP